MTTLEIGEAIRRRRESLRLRQEDLSEMSGITAKTIHLIENATGNPSIQTLEKLATVLGLEIVVQIKKV